MLAVQHLVGASRRRVFGFSFASCEIWPAVRFMGGECVTAATRRAVARRGRLACVGTRSWLPTHPSVVFCSEKLLSRLSVHTERDAQPWKFHRRGCVRCVGATAEFWKLSPVQVRAGACADRPRCVQLLSQSSPQHTYTPPRFPAAAHRRAPARGPGIQVSTPPLAVVVTSQRTLGATAHEAGGWPGVLYGHSITRPRAGSAATSGDCLSSSSRQREAGLPD